MNAYHGPVESLKNEDTYEGLRRAVEARRRTPRPKRRAMSPRTREALACLAFAGVVLAALWFIAWAYA